MSLIKRYSVIKYRFDFEKTMTEDESVGGGTKLKDSVKLQITNNLMGHRSGFTTIFINSQSLI